MAAMIQAEIGYFNRFSSSDKILAFAGLSPTTYQSGNFTSSKAKMDKRGSRYLRYALSHVAKKLLRIICHLQKTGEPFQNFS